MLLGADLAGKCARVPAIGVLSDGVLAMDLGAPALFALFPESARSIFYMGRAVPLFAAYLYMKIAIKCVPCRCVHSFDGRNGVILPSRPLTQLAVHGNRSPWMAGLFCRFLPWLVVYACIS